MVFPYIDLTSVLQDLRLLVFDFRKSVPGEKNCVLQHTFSMLRAHDLGKRYSDRWIFRHLSFSLETGDALIILGPNGSGKSTLLKIVSGLLSPSEGEIEKPREDPRTALGLSALDMQVYGHLTVAEHLQLVADLRGIVLNEDVLLQVGLQERVDQLAMQLSTGMRARLKLALAIQAKPSVLLLDEPGAGLDESGRALLDEICLRQRERGCLLIATNDPNERRLGTLELDLAS